MVMDNQGFFYPQVDVKNCVDCGLCNKVCPIENANLDKMIYPSCYACTNKNEEVLKKSSSGGVFSEISKFIIGQGGVVYGASLENAITVKHVRVDNITDLEKLYGSKYIQSDTGNCYNLVTEDLKNGLTVLFTGTPCQISGLKKFLGKEYDNLYTQDLICHGVPSKLIWEKFLNENGFTTNAKVWFRDKTYGWEKFSVKITEGEREFLEPFSENIFFKFFLSDMFLRPSCYQCKFKTITRDADITLADFWGRNNAQDNGLSAVCVHSKKGECLFDNVKDNLYVEQVDFESVVDGNKCCLFSADKKINKEKLYKGINKNPLHKTFKKANKKSLFKKAIKKIIRIRENKGAIAYYYRHK